jgi:hypothetical protein
VYFLFRSTSICLSSYHFPLFSALSLTISFFVPYPFFLSYFLFPLCSTNVCYKVIKCQTIFRYRT